MLTSVKPTASSIPFDTKRLDGLMEDAGIDVLLATSKHNVQYLLGGHRAFFFDYMDAMGLSRYLPIVVYAKGAPDRAAFFGHRLENFQREVKTFWTPETNCTSSGSVDVMKKAVDQPIIRNPASPSSAPTSRHSSGKWLSGWARVEYAEAEMNSASSIVGSAPTSR